MAGKQMQHAVIKGFVEFYTQDLEQMKEFVVNRMLKDGRFNKYLEDNKSPRDYITADECIQVYIEHWLKNIQVTDSDLKFKTIGSANSKRYLHNRHSRAIANKQGKSFHDFIVERMAQNNYMISNKCRRESDKEMADKLQKETELMSNLLKEFSNSCMVETKEEPDVQ